MTKAEILESLKDFNDTDEIKFIKKVGYWVPAPEDSWDGDVYYRDEVVHVDSLQLDKHRSSKFRVVDIVRVDDETFRMFCLEPYHKFDEKNFPKGFQFRTCFYNFKKISKKHAFDTREALIEYANNFVGKASGHKYSASEIIWGTLKEDEE